MGAAVFIGAGVPDHATIGWSPAPILNMFQIFQIGVILNSKNVHNSQIVWSETGCLVGV
jgi:hypothetical protein